MFQAVFRRAEVAVENAIGSIVVRLVVAVPFMLAAGFGIAAFWMYLSRSYGAESAAMMMGGGFLLLGILAGVVAGMRSPIGETSDETQTSEPVDALGRSTSSDEALDMSKVDKDLLKAALTSIAPVAVPHVARMVVRNLPVIAALGAALFLYLRSDDSDGSTAEQVAPAE